MPRLKPTNTLGVQRPGSTQEIARYEIWRQYQSYLKVLAYEAPEWIPIYQKKRDHLLIPVGFSSWAEFKIAYEEWKAYPLQEKRISSSKKEENLLGEPCPGTPREVRHYKKWEFRMWKVDQSKNSNPDFAQEMLIKAKSMDIPVGFNSWEEFETAYLAWNAAN